ncbi:DUF6166 domain-containing protein [Halobacteria archaeon AArc-m2/3/4]|uniref:DUF6166 domain-containing protein n=1 Tax=Natronoglomus mannanivorans TaxID=2979990 RepID=A0AAP2Z4D8_9EURY|nr:DUF6166 domain-containing protein [Halobacteria archaeon AArc-xg1-1]MCU4975072.1 DUF6166 domain-containing protein [Halobacteria archaeon AArc-m2/3/4]
MSGTTERRSTEQEHRQTTNNTVYVGLRRQGRPVVRRVGTDDELSPDRSLEVRNHSPTGFEWGYNGSGPAQLALAILLDYTDDEGVALEHYMRFKDEVVSRLECTAPDGCWHLSAGMIETVLRDEAELEVTVHV